MESKELRIGNLVNYRGFPSMVGAISSNETYIYLDKGIVNPKVEDIEPIPLTEEWLLKFGFKKNQRDIRFKRLGSIVLKSTEKGFKFNYRESITYIHFVHQIQNLYFALNGVELTLRN